MACSVTAFAEGLGTICVAPGAFDAFAKGAATVEAYEAQQAQPQTATAKPAQAIRYVQVDQGTPVKVTSLAPGKVTGIEMVGRHMLSISSQAGMRSREQSFYFRFEDHHSNSLCLWYKPFYASWSLQALRGSVCRCR